MPIPIFQPPRAYGVVVSTFVYHRGERGSNIYRNTIIKNDDINQLGKYTAETFLTQIRCQASKQTNICLSQSLDFH